MNVQRISVKFFTKLPVDIDGLKSVVPVLHGWIQKSSVPGMLLDVADYRHMVDGPGVVLVGHDCDYSLDLERGEAGLLYVGKHRGAGAPVGESLREAIGRAALGAQLLEQAGVSLSFKADEIEVMLRDRLAAPNDGDSYSSIAGELEAISGEALGGSVSLSRDGSDARRCITVRIKASAATSLGDIVSRLGVTAPQAG